MGTEPGATRRFRVALSFPGEYREPTIAALAERLAATLTRDRVLYDRFHDAELARPDLDVYLPELYRTQADLIVVVLCPEYATKAWCRLEWRHIRSLIAGADGARIMFLSFGDPGDLTAIGVVRGDGFIDITGMPVDTVAAKIVARLNASASAVVAPPPPGPIRVGILLGHSRKRPLPEAAQMAIAAVKDLRDSDLDVRLTLDEASRDALDRLATAGCDLLIFYGHGHADGSLDWTDGKKWYADLSATPARRNLWQGLSGAIVFACHGESFAKDLPCPWLAFRGVILRQLPAGTLARLAGALAAPDATWPDAICAAVAAAAGTLAVSGSPWPGRGVARGTVAILRAPPAILRTCHIDYVGSPTGSTGYVSDGPFVGRQDEVESLGNLPDRSGLARLACHWIWGEACVGKSSLLAHHAELVRQLAFSVPTEPVWLLHADCHTDVTARDLERRLVDKANSLYRSASPSGRSHPWPHPTDLSGVMQALQDVPGRHVWILDDVTYTRLKPDDLDAGHDVPRRIAEWAKHHQLVLQLVVSARFAGPAFGSWRNVQLEELAATDAVQLAEALYQEAVLAVPGTDELRRLHREVAGGQLAHFKRGVWLCIQRRWSIDRYAREVCTGEGTAAANHREFSRARFSGEMRILQGLAPEHGFDYRAFLDVYWRLIQRAGWFTAEELETWFGDTLCVPGLSGARSAAYRKALDSLEATSLVDRRDASGETRFLMPPNQRVNLQAFGQGNAVIPSGVPNRGARDGLLALLEHLQAGGDIDRVAADADTYRSLYADKEAEEPTALYLCMSYLVEIECARKNDLIDRELELCDTLTSRFGSRAEPGIAEQVAIALVNKGVRLGAVNRPDDAIAVYDDVVSRFGSRAEPGIAEQVAGALVNKGVRLGTLNRSEDAIAVYDDVVSRFGSREEPGIAEQVAGALFNKGVRLGTLNRSEDAIAVYDDVVSRFGSREEPGIAEQVAKALVNKGVRLGKLDRPDDAIAVYDDVVSRFGSRAEPGIAEQVAKALINKAVTLATLNRPEDAIAAVNDVRARFGTRAEESLAEIVEKADQLRDFLTKKAAGADAGGTGSSTDGDPTAG